MAGDACNHQTIIPILHMGKWQQREAEDLPRVIWSQETAFQVTCSSICASSHRWWDSSPDLLRGMGSVFKLAASSSTVLWPLFPSCSADSGAQEAWLPVKIILRTASRNADSAKQCSPRERLQKVREPEAKADPQKCLCTQTCAENYLLGEAGKGGGYKNWKARQHGWTWGRLCREK